ncbi:MAG: hypothetical protein IPG43_18250 [Proteobacteria bacterium]|nr:hypothetical protein [Pseudomonadota bacterium]
MSLLLDVFSFLSVLLRCLALTGAALVVGGVLFRHGVVLPVIDRATGPARDVLARLAKVLRGSAWLLALTAAATAGIDSMVMMGSVGMSAGVALTAPSNIAALAIVAGALTMPSATPTRRGAHRWLRSRCWSAWCRPPTRSVVSITLR